ncbi:hypothetical protein ABT340_12210 [Streptosporangium sp. NPDC000239]|uniref:hypothetical protein n=1 Tax=Streptosporangium sp. NPDC000239 TaxID=3154248 RepID=UPI00332A23DE
MDFFTAPPPPERKPMKREKRPPWLGPPEDFVGAVVPVDRTLFRTEALAIVLTDALAFPEGVTLNVRMAFRRLEGVNDDVWWDRHDRLFDFHGHHGSRLSDEVMRLGVRFSDGSKATTVDGAPGTGEQPSPHSDGPVLHLQGSGDRSGGDDFATGHWPLWLWPLPPPEPFEVAVEWPAFEVPLTFTEIDGAPLVAAARRAHSYWP